MTLSIGSRVGEDASLNILLVENDLFMRDLVAEALRADGHRVREAGDGDTALIYLLDRTWCPHPPDVLLTDVRMPGHDGLAVVTLLRVSGYHMPVFLMTALPDHALAGAEELGITQIFRKPFEIADLRRAMASVAAASRTTPSPHFR